MIGARFALLLAVGLSPSAAFAACTSPAGNAGDIGYSSTQNIMVYCNGTGWVNMGTNTTSAVGFGTLTTGDFCQATSGTQIACTAAQINLASQVTGVLPTVNGGTGLSAYVTGDLLYASASNTLSRLAAGTNGYVLTMVSGAPAWAASTGGVTSFSAGTTGLNPATATTGAVVLAGTLGVPNGGTGLTALTANVIYKGNGTGVLATSALTDNGTIVTSSEDLDITGANGMLTEIANAGTTGTTLNKLVKLNTSGAAVIAAVTDTDGIVGLLAGGSGTTGNAQITVSGQAQCVFDNTTVAGHFVTISSSTAGDCHDAGATRPTASETIGQVLASGAAGTYAMVLDISPSSTASGAPTGTGTTNYVARWTPNGTTLGTGTLYDNGTQVGIGTTVPDRLLEVYGQAHIGNDLFLTRTDSTATASIVVDNSVTTGIALQKQGGGTIGNIQLNASTVYIPAGNVGIGTTSPNATLDTYGSSTYRGASNVGGLFHAGVATTNDASLIVGSLNGNNPYIAAGQLGNGTYTNLSFQTSNTTAMNILANGNVGIGTTTPRGLLEMSNAGGSPSFALTDRTQGTDAKTWDFETNGGVLYGRTVNDAYTAAAAWVSIARTGAVPTSVSFPNGNVGIGTTAPTKQLDILANLTVDFNAGLRIAGASNSYGPTLTLENDGTGGRKFLIIPTGPSNSGGAGNFDIYDATAAADRFVINSTGNVGIGSTGPVVSLDLSQKTDAIALPAGTTAQRPATLVNGELRYNATTPGVEAYVNGAWLTLGASGGTVTGAGTTNYVARWTPNGSTLGTSSIYDTGSNVTIGGTSGSGKLDVEFDPAITANSASNFIGTWNQLTTAEAFNYTAGLYDLLGRINISAAQTGTINTVVGVQGDLYDYSAKAVSAAYGVNGNINNEAGGTISTAEGLRSQISNIGTGAITTAYDIYVAPMSVGSGSIGTGYGLYIGSVAGTTSNYSIYASDPTAKSYFAGNVGIGTTSPTTALQVNGTVTAAAFTGIASSCQTATASLLNQSNVSTATASCPGNLKAIAGGATCTAAFLVNNGPSGQSGTGLGTGWVGTCYQNGVSSVGVTVYATCCP